MVGDIDALPNVLSMTADVRVLWDLHRLGINIDVSTPHPLSCPA